MRVVRAAVLVFVCGAGAARSETAASKAPSNDDCLACHEDPGAKRADGRPVFVDKIKFASSIHGQAGLSCVDCHKDLAAATDFPHAEKLAPVACAGCHEQQGAEYEKSSHADFRRRLPASKAPGCADCHGSHGILPSKDPASATNHFNVPATCLKCHADPAIDPKAAAPANAPARFTDSIHGKALEKSGLQVAPNCATCHGAHEIRRPENDPKSSVFRTNIPSTCGTCHPKILGIYEESIHGALLKKGNPKVPVCADCHTAHAIVDRSDPERRLQILKQCGTCHEPKLKTYRDTYHGQVTALGFTAIATCADCHTPHHQYPINDPRSSVSPANRRATCQKCHKGVSANFVRYDPHADPRDRGRNPMLYFTALFMRWLLVGVFSFFGIHTLLWFPSSYRVRGQGPRDGPGAEHDPERRDDE